MKIFLLANNSVGLEIAKFLVKNNEQIVGLAIHEKDKQKYTQEIIDVVQLPQSKIYNAKSLRDKKTVSAIKKDNPDIAISAFWGYILKPDFLSIFPKRCINFHPGYLPFNRGMNPNVWPLVEGTPAGVTLHYVDYGIDTGAVIARKKVKIVENDTAETIYDKTLESIVKLFKEKWGEIRSNKIKGISQDELGDTSTFHWLREVGSLDEIELDKMYTGKEIINRLKARSYSDRFYSYYKSKGRKVFLRVEMGPVIDENE